MGVCSYGGGTIPAHSKQFCEDNKGVWSEGTAEEKGFQFFIVPSVEFIKRIIKRKNIQAVLGVTCIHDIIEGLKQEKLNPKGLFLNGKKIVPIVIQLPKYDCVNNDVDWELVKKQINEL